MLNLAHRRLDRCGLGLERVEFVHADALSWGPPLGFFDLIVTHFFLDCFPDKQLKRLLAVLAQACGPRAKWLLADFQIPARGMPRWRALLIHRMMYGFFRVVTGLPARELTTPDPILAGHGFVLQKRKINDWGLLHSDLWENANQLDPAAAPQSSTT
jgi:hypothetical protein